ncbi:MAG: diguanylate cyclase [Geobacteraceae bacterium]|nr:diguanylate cyclase [Geobacteraceae bacterium]
MFRFRLNTKISIVVSLLVTIQMVGLSYWIISHVEKSFKQTIAAQQFVLLSDRAHDIDEAISRFQHMIIAKAAFFSRQGIVDPERAQHELDESEDLLGIFDNGLFLFSSRGELLAELPNQHRRGQNVAYRDYFKKTMESGKPCISRPYFTSRASHHPAIMFTAPVFAQNGTIVAILGGSVDLLQENMLSHNAYVKIGNSGYTYIYNTERTIIMHPDKSRILKQDEPPGVNRVFDKGIAGFEGTEENVNSRGLRALTTVKRLKSANWIMAANYPLADAYAPIQKIIRYSIIAVILGVLLSVLVVWLVMKKLTAPLIRLTGHIKELEDNSGENRAILIDSADEIEDLSVAFNHMMGTITSKQEELQKLSRAVEQSASLVAITDTNGIIEYINPTFCELTGYSAAELIGRNPSILKSGELSAERYRELWDTITNGGTWQGEFHNRKKNGGQFWTIATISPIKNEQGLLTHFISVQEDITERRAAEVKLRHLSTHDILTGLYNRAFFEEELERLKAGRRFPVSVITADVDGLKGVNDTLGHEAGDRLLRMAGKALFDTLRSEDIVARIGGDEFGVLLPAADDSVVAEVMTRIRTRQAEFNAAGDDFVISISLGSATAQTAEDLARAMKLSDERMYREKNARKEKPAAPLLPAGTSS